VRLRTDADAEDDETDRIIAPLLQQTHASQTVQDYLDFSAPAIGGAPRVLPDIEAMHREHHDKFEADYPIAAATGYTPQGVLDELWDISAGLKYAEREDPDYEAGSDSDDSDDGDEEEEPALSLAGKSKKATSKEKRQARAKLLNLEKQGNDFEAHECPCKCKDNWTTPEQIAALEKFRQECAGLTQNARRVFVHTTLAALWY
jgi:hypothetical protein